MTPLARYVTAALCGSLVAAACGQQKAPVEDSLDPAVIAYGYAPPPDPNVTLQPDVVIVGGGARSVRSADADGITYTIDGRATNAQNLAVGRVLFLTSGVVGRLVKLEKQGADLRVVLAPVSITHIVKEGNLRFDQELTPDAFRYRLSPSYGPQSAAQLSDPNDVRPMPVAWHPASRLGPFLQQLGLQAARLGAQESRTLDTTKLSFKVKVGVLDVEPYIQGDKSASELVKKIGVKLSRGEKIIDKKTGDLTSAGGAGNHATMSFKFAADIALYGRKIKLNATLPIHEGKVGADASFALEGIEGMTLGLLAGVERGRADNVKIRAIEVPMEVFVQVPPAPPEMPLPMVFQIKFKVYVDFTFSSKNSTLESAGRYKFDGKIGYENGSFTAPTMTVIEPMLGSIAGMTIGPAAVAAGMEARFLWGVGTRAFSTGPYGKIKVLFNVSQGSLLGTPLLLCKGVALNIDVGYGAGVQVAPGASELLQKILPKDSTMDWDLFERVHTVVDGFAVTPDNPVCRGNAP